VNPLRTAPLLLCLAAHSACADQFPLWEAGAGIGVTVLPHYRGSDQSKTWVLPVPYLDYRGDLFKVDDRRPRGTLFGSDRVELELSLNGSPPVDDDNARRGMPRLDPTLEIGPSLNIALYRSANRMERLELRLPVRTTFASDFSYVAFAGWIFQPNLSMDFKNVLGNRGWNLGLQTSAIYSDRRYNQYFYAVDPAFATADRPAYNPNGGYGGMNLLAAVSKRFPGFWFGAFAKWDSVAGAVFDNSPLVKTRNNLSGGFAVAWILSASTVLVEAQD
jgi:outer membrane protein